MALQAAVAAEHDGYTRLYVPTITNSLILPELHEKLPGGVRTLSLGEIGLVRSDTMVIAAGRALTVSTLDRARCAARKEPRRMVYAPTTAARSPISRRNCGGTAPRRADDVRSLRRGNTGLQDILGGRVSVIVESVGALSGAIRGGKGDPYRSRLGSPGCPCKPTCRRCRENDTGLRSVWAGSCPVGAARHASGSRAQDPR